jgi:hypothetical protein
VDAVVRGRCRSRHAIRLQPSGGYAANLLGLSDQVPMRIRVPDGRNQPPRPNREAANHPQADNAAQHGDSAGKTSGLVIQALRHLGQRHSTIKIIHEVETAAFSQRDKKQLFTDLRHAPVWVATVDASNRSNLK